jgi:hypothetical protein
MIDFAKWFRKTFHLDTLLDKSRRVRRFAPTLRRNRPCLALEALEDRQLLSLSPLFQVHASALSSLAPATPAVDRTLLIAPQSRVITQTLQAERSSRAESLYKARDLSTIEVIDASWAIRAEYAKLGGANGFLGRALGGMTAVPDGSGYSQTFQNGSIYWSWDTGAHEVQGAIRDKWLALRGPQRENGLGYPTTDEMDDGFGGRVSHFQEGDIDWSPATGAHEIHGAILEKWNDLRAHGFNLGHPTSDETDDGLGGRVSHFQYGDIDWSPATGAHEMHGAILARWNDLRTKGVDLGHPISDEGGTSDHRSQQFEHGELDWFAQGPVSTLAIWEETKSGTVWTIHFSWVFNQSYDKAIVGWRENGGNWQQSDVSGNKEGSYTIQAYRGVWYDFQVEGGNKVEDWLGFTQGYHYTGWSQAVGYSLFHSATAPAAKGSAPTTNVARTSMQISLSGDWSKFISATNAYVVAAPLGTDLSKAPKYPLTSNLAFGGNPTATIPASAGSSGAWVFQIHIQGFYADGSSTGDLTSPVYETPSWNSGGIVALVSLDSDGTGNGSWGLVSYL